MIFCCIKSEGNWVYDCSKCSTICYLLSNCLIQLKETKSSVFATTMSLRCYKKSSVFATVKTVSSVYATT